MESILSVCVCVWVHACMYVAMYVIYVHTDLFQQEHMYSHAGSCR